MSLHKNEKKVNCLKETQEDMKLLGHMDEEIDD